MDSRLLKVFLCAGHSALASTKPVIMMLVIALTIGVLPSQVLAATSPTPAESSPAPATPTPSATPSKVPSAEPSPSPSPTATEAPAPRVPPPTVPAPAPAPAAVPQPTAGPGALPPKLAPAPPDPKVAAPPIEDSEPLIEGAEVANEVLDKRTEYSRTLKNKDGSFTVQSFTGPIHFKDSKGDWEQVESALVASDKAGYALKNKAHSFGIEIKDQLGPDAIALEVPAGSYTLSPEALGGAKAKVTETLLGKDPSKAPKVASFKGAAKGTDLEYQVTPTGLKETIILQARIRRAPSPIC